MKYWTPLVICFVLFFSCQEPAKEVTSLKISVDDATATSVELRRQIKGLLIWDKAIDSLTKSDNNFTLDFQQEEPEYNSVKAGKKYFKLITLPNQNYEIKVTDSSIIYKGDNAKGQELYNALERPDPFTMYLINQYANDSTARQLSEKQRQIKAVEQEKINKLFDEGHIDELFHELMIVESDYYYDAAIYSVAEAKYERASDDRKEAFSRFMDSLVSRRSYKAKYRPLFWGDFNVEAFGRIPATKGLDRDAIGKLYEKDSMYVIYANAIKENVENPFREQVLAHLLIREVRQMQYQKSLIGIYDAFKADYPNSVFIPYLDSDIDTFRKFHLKTIAELPDGVTILDNTKFSSLVNLLPEFEGEKIYIDMWATWCRPCINEFTYNDKIEDILKANNYKKLYISLDKAKAEEKWLQLIKFHDLYGYHLLASREFFVDFEKNHSTMEGMVAIPQYLIVSEKGEIITNDAPSPSEAEALEAFISGL